MIPPRLLTGFRLAAVICGWATIVSAEEESVASPVDPATPPLVASAETSALKAERDQALKVNEIITLAQTAMTQKKWAEAADAMRQLVAIEPARWDFHRGLGDALLKLGQYVDAISSYEAGYAMAQQPLAAARTPAQTQELRLALAQMLVSEGNACLKLRRSDAAIAAYAKAADLDPHPATAYFNLAATCYNEGKMETALSYCDRTIAADPAKADAYFIKGSILLGNSQTDKNGRTIPPPGTIEALRKYLELKPNGPHAPDVQEMLKFVGAEPAPTKS